MPLIEIHLAEGRTKDQKRKLLESVTQAVHESLNVPLTSVRVWIDEFAPDEFMIAGELMSELRKKGELK